MFICRTPHLANPLKNLFPILRGFTCIYELQNLSFLNQGHSLEERDTHSPLGTNSFANPGISCMGINSHYTSTEWNLLLKMQLTGSYHKWKSFHKWDQLKGFKSSDWKLKFRGSEKLKQQWNSHFLMVFRFNLLKLQAFSGSFADHRGSKLRHWSRKKSRKFICDGDEKKELFLENLNEILRKKIEWFWLKGRHGFGPNQTQKRPTSEEKCCLLDVYVLGWREQLASTNLSCFWIRGYHY